MITEKPKPAAEENPNKWEDDFFTAEGITDDNEKAAIRGRARVLAYDRARQRAAEAKEGSTKKDKKWYDPD